MMEPELAKRLICVDCGARAATGVKCATCGGVTAGIDSMIGRSALERAGAPAAAPAMRADVPASAAPEATETDRRIAEIAKHLAAISKAVRLWYFLTFIGFAATLVVLLAWLSHRPH